MNDGTFGVTGDAKPLDEEMVARVEGHRYEPVRVLQWRNSALDFFSPERLIESLDEPPPARGLVKARPSMRLRSACACFERPGRDPRAGAARRRPCGACGMPARFRISANSRSTIMCGWCSQIFVHLMSDDGVLPGRLARAADRAPRRNRRRCGDALRPSRANPHLDLCRASAGLGRRSARIGRTRRAPSRTGCPMRCTNG